MPLRFSPIPILFVFIFGCSHAHTRRVPWEDKPRMITENFIVYAEPDLKEEEFRGQILEAARIRKNFQSAFFPEAGKKKLKILLYRDQKSYSRYRKIPIDSLADYERRENRMNVSNDAPLLVWKHELSHAMIESARPGAPYWLHEGMALFLQEENFTTPPDCRFPRKASMPESLSASLKELRSRDKLIPGKEFNTGLSASPEFNASIAGYFIFYLWDKKLLIQFLREFQSSKKSAKSILTRGSHEKIGFIIDDFTRWIKTVRPLMALSGC